ncbi:MAG: hypothetical protein QXG97_07500 [Nitrososphaerota archaeon]
MSSAEVPRIEQLLRRQEQILNALEAWLRQVRGLPEPKPPPVPRLVRGETRCETRPVDGGLDITCRRDDKIITALDDEVEERTVPKSFSTRIPARTMDCLREFEAKAGECELKLGQKDRIAALYACRLREEQSRGMPRETLAGALKIPVNSVSVQRDELVQAGILEKRLPPLKTGLGEFIYDLTAPAMKALELKKAPRGLSCDELKAFKLTVLKGLK